MNFQELIFIVGIFLAVSYSVLSYTADFGFQEEMPSEVTSTWDKMKEKTDNIYSEMKKDLESVTSDNPLEQAKGYFSLAFHGAWYVIVSVAYMILTGADIATGGVRYVSATLGLPSNVITIVSVLIGISLIFAVIKFLSGREV